MKWIGRAALIFVWVFFLASCATVPAKKPTWTPGNALALERSVAVSDDLDAASLDQALERSLEKLKTLNAEDVIVLGNFRTNVGKIQATLEDFRSRLAQMGLTADFFEYIRANYLFFRSASRKVLFTGYYEPLLLGSLQPSPLFSHPLYRCPDDLVTIELKQFPFYSQYPGLPPQIKGRLREERRIVPYYSRKEIEDESRLAGKNLEIVWIDDPVEVFFLQIQGSGIVELEDGQRLRVGYAEQNGHPYRSIGKLLIDSGAIGKNEQSMQSIKRHLREHPEQMSEILNANPSYIFFRLLENGPIGSFGVALTPWRSVATDRRLYPQGALMLIQSEKPVLDGNGRILRWEKFWRFVINQDTGGAIRGPDRVDLFCGSGPESELTAGSMRQEGTFYFLLKKD